MVTHSLDKMAAGGIYDHLGGGFARYSVDAQWLVPHFEKMLYDNAMLARCYVEAFQVTGAERYASVARETFGYVLREMTHEQGGFFSAQDADSEGEEGKFYVWTPAQVQEVLGDEAAETFCYVYDVSETGNFEGKNILHLPKTIEQCAAVINREAGELRAELAVSREKLLAARNNRVWPGLDDKTLVSWNALMIDALAYAAGALQQPHYLQAAQKAADFILQNMRRDDGRLLHSWRSGQARFDAYLDDYACLADALVTLYEACWEEWYLEEALRLTDIVQRHFADEEHGGYFYTADDHEQLIARQKDLQDNPTPSGAAMAANCFIRLGKLTGRRDLLQAAERTLESCAEFMRQAPMAVGQMLMAADLFLGPTHEIAIVGAADHADIPAVVSELRKRFIPRHIAALGDVSTLDEPGPLSELFEGKTTAGSDPAVYVCQDFACQSPAVGKEEILAKWEDLEAAG